MPAFLTSLISNIGPYVAALVIGLGSGFYAGYHWCLPQVESARLALSQQQANDAKVTAQWNAQAAAYESEISQLSDAQLTARDDKRQAASAAGTAQEQALSVQAGKPGQDGPSAAVLLSERANLQQMISGGGQ